jgi:phospholipase C
VCGDLTSAFDFARADDRVPPLPSTAAYKPTGQAKPTYTPTPPAVGAVPTQEPGVRPSRRLGYRFEVAFSARPSVLGLAVANDGALGVHLQARSLSVPGAPYSYTIGPGSELTTTLPNPGTYDLSLHGPNGFFRHFAGSRATVISVESHSEPRSSRLTVRLELASGGEWGDRGRGGRARPILVHVADAYGAGRDLELHESRELMIETSDSGGWYDVTLTTPTDPTFAVQLAGRLESSPRLTSDPQLGRS